MANQYVNKVVLTTGETLINLENDTISINDVAFGKLFHLPDGAVGTGTMQNGDSLAYGITDGTLPLAGVAKVGQAEI